MPGRIGDPAQLSCTCAFAFAGSASTCTDSMHTRPVAPQVGNIWASPTMWRFMHAVVAAAIASCAAAAACKDSFGNDGLKKAVGDWVSDRVAGEQSYGEIDTWCTSEASTTSTPAFMFSRTLAPWLHNYTGGGSRACTSMCVPQ